MDIRQELVVAAVQKFTLHRHLRESRVVDIIKEMCGPEPDSGYNLSNIATVVNGDNPFVLLSINEQWEVFDATKFHHLQTLNCAAGMLLMTHADGYIISCIGNETLGTFPVKTEMEIFTHTLALYFTNKYLWSVGL